MKKTIYTVIATLLFLISSCTLEQEVYNKINPGMFPQNAEDVNALVNSSALLLCAIVSTLASFMWGGITLVIVMFGGLGITSQLQRKGLHRKDKRKGIYIVSRTFIRDRKK